MIVIGMHFGDEGKGLTTSFLCSQNTNPIVVRFNGGHQAGHTVVYKGVRHIFSSFGSGSLQGVPTYWSSNCTLYPSAFLKEYYTLDKPIIYVNPLCPVTTPFDIDHNQLIERQYRHGSVGVGFGATIQRQEDHYKLFVQDLFYEDILRTKLQAIALYYKRVDVDNKIQHFMEEVKKLKPLITVTDNFILKDYNPIFEGAQGILLDMDFGFFPNVTRSNTTTKNALQLYNAREVYYVTRSYLTRHGNGFLPKEKKLTLQNYDKETNKTHNFQGKFRTAELDINFMNYSLQCDNYFSCGLKKNLIVTCMDQYDINVKSMLSKLKTTFNKIYISRGDSLNDIIQLK